MQPGNHKTDLQLAMQTSMPNEHNQAHQPDAFQHTINTQVSYDYQPIFYRDVTKRPVLEALLRWTEHKNLCPNQLLNTLGLKQLEALTLHALRTLTHTLTQLPPDTRIALNLNTQQLNNPTIINALHQLEFSVRRCTELEVRITNEADLMTLRTHAESLQVLGYAVMLDNITPETARLPLESVAANGVKLDVSVMKAFDPSADTWATQYDRISTLISTLQNTGMPVTAVGITSPVQHALLTSAGCARFQGYGLAKPSQLELLQAHFSGLGQVSSRVMM